MPTEPRPRRILILASVRWYNASAAYAVELAQALSARGHVVRAVVKPGSPVEFEARRRGLEVAAGFDLTATGPGAVFGAVRGLRALIREFRPHVLNPHRSEDHLLAGAASRGSGVPIVRTRGDVRPPRAHLANRVVYRRYTAAHVACADFMPARFYAPLGIDPGEVTVIRPGVDLEAWRRGAPEPEAARRMLGMEGAPPWIGLIGRFTEAKGHRTLLAALARMRRPARLLVSGDENEITAAALRAEASALGVGDRVRVAGRIGDVRTALRSLGVLAVPSVASEAISRIAIEGLALGVPTVASRMNSLPEVVGTAGLLVPSADPGALAEALDRMIGEPERAEAARKAGPERIARRYDRTTQIALTEDVFERAISGSGG